MNDEWKLKYADKLSNAQDALRLVKPGRRVLIGSGAAEPVTLVEQLAASPDLTDVEIVHLLTLGPAPYVDPALGSRFRHTAFFIGGNVREAVQQGRADFIPVFLSEIPELIRSRRVRIDVALIQTSVPDAHGFVSLGVSVDVVRAAVDTASVVLCEVNPQMPRTHGDSFLHVSKIDKLVPVDSPLLALPSSRPGEVERAIGEHVARLVPNGATIQAGIGEIPDAVLGALAQHRDLGIHTEMFSDGMMALVQSGVATGAKKARLRRKHVTSFVMGSRELYEWANDNPALELRASDFTNDPRVIASNPSMVAVNSALAVDLTGQVAADSLAGKFYSGIGGQVDFIRGAAGSPGGRAIIALRSTAKQGTISRICPALETGTGVVTSRGDVRYVVTEYGVADLWGRSVRERALALIEVAHPQYRAELLSGAKARCYVFPEQPLPAAIYPWREEYIETLPGIGRVLVRPIRASDADALVELLHDVSGLPAHERRDGAAPGSVLDEVKQLASADYIANLALVAWEPTTNTLVGFARYDVDPATLFARIQFAVRDEWQGRGIGTCLMRRLRDAARANGLKGLTAVVSADNRGMFLVIQDSGLSVDSRFDGTNYHLTMPFETVEQADS